VDDSDNNSAEMESLKTEIWEAVLPLIKTGHGEVKVVVKRTKNCSIEILILPTYSRRVLLTDSGRDGVERIVLRT
jgi:septum formation topological specificity factor MinE